MKKGIRYLRFSHDDQSQHSIERQDLLTAHWMEQNSVLIVDTFKDEGYTARNFDRPDIKELFEFIRKNHRGIDFMVVSELTRFSRETGDAINMVKKIQRDYSIRIVSASRGAIYDCLDHNSFFMMGLEFLLGNSENIKRQNDINGGVYTAKKKGYWIQGGAAPYGFIKEQYKEDGKNRIRLVIKEAEAIIIRYIYEAYLANTPLYVIEQRVKEMGFSRTGNGRVSEILKHPLYAGHQYVKPLKDLPGGLFPLKNHKSIIDMNTWQAVQQKINRPARARVAVAEDFPLRGVLHCHCKKLLTGAPSKSRNGSYYNYYKCNTASSHNNLSAREAHKQLREALGWMSMPSHLATAIREKSQQVLEEKSKDNKVLLEQKQIDFDKLEKQLVSVEEKWINNQMNHDTYQRWHDDLSRKRIALRGEIEKLAHDQSQLYFLLQDHLNKLTDLQAVFSDATTVQKQELLRMVFDNTLYYQDKAYRTAYLMPVFAHNELILKQKHLLILDQSPANLVKWRPQAPNRTAIITSDTFIDLLFLVGSIRVA